jgi:DNA-binding NarL/FixJ family response regulator
MRTHVVLPFYTPPAPPWPHHAALARRGRRNRDSGPPSDAADAPARTPRSDSRRRGPSGAAGSSPVPAWASAAARAAGLTRREWEVLGLLVAGASNHAIAGTLNISRHTAVRHVANVMRKLHVASRSEAVARALGLDAPSSAARP